MKITRHMEGHHIPDEQYEVMWREAMELLESAGPRAGFVLLTVMDEGENFSMRFAMSSGGDRIPQGVLSDLCEKWLANE